jgi:hypothetical protein
MATSIVRPKPEGRCEVSMYVHTCKSGCRSRLLDGPSHEFNSEGGHSLAACAMYDTSHNRPLKEP